MIEERIAVDTGAGCTHAHLFRPQQQGRWPGVICLTDVLGLREVFKTMARRIAAEGYVVLLPHLFHAYGQPPMFEGAADFREPGTWQRAQEIMRSLPPSSMRRDGAAYVDTLLAQRSVRGEKAGVVGFCFSGAMALYMAAERPDRIGAAASFHGGELCTDDSSSPHRELPRIRAKLYFAHAQDDAHMPSDAIVRLEGSLQSWGGAYVSEIYPGARHGWTVRDRPAYSEKDAERAFDSLRNLFRTTFAQPTAT
ncbi:dienelactone hydrolase family protein [Peristeroidobacter agariperforans]|uniref:dienelactone hydrolase family protein n=1 Tax=Peristeroidobacter agariperforans TaxID=268404 RepID=UPI00101BE40A|nr:dienelactone hydrolase family protein [Peristeroidobacter agariperforans]